MYRSVGLDIFLTTARQGQGLGREALRLVIAHYLERGHHRFTIDPAADNERAIRAYAAVGFKPVGRMRDYELGADGTWHDGLLMDLLGRRSSCPAGLLDPMENIASRSWREKTSKATIVWVRLTPGSLTSSPVTTSASISWRGTRTMATKSHSPVTE